MGFSGQVFVMFCFGHRDLQPDLYKAEAFDFVGTGSLLQLFLIAVWDGLLEALSAQR